MGAGLFGVQFVPPQEFDSKEWWEPVRAGPRWFYHSPRLRPAVTGLVSISTVDEDLVKLVQTLWSRGFTTHASCAGHAASEPQSRKLFAALLRDVDSVRGAGLVLQNVETGTRVGWRQRDYNLPWTDAAQLHGHLEDHALVGCLGVSGEPTRLYALSTALASLGCVYVECRGTELWLWVEQPDLPAQRSAWQTVTRKVMNGSL